MKIVIQEAQSKLFYRKNSWTENYGEALSFRTTKSAIRYCVTLNLCGVLLIAVFKDGSQYLRYKVPSTLKGKTTDRTGRLLIADNRLSAYQQSRASGTAGVRDSNFSSTYKKELIPDKDKPSGT